MPTVMLISTRDATSAMMRAVVDTWPLFSRAGHCLRSGCTLTGVLLVIVPVTDCAAKSFSSDMCCVTPLMASKCAAANSDHLLVRTSVDFDKATSSSSLVKPGVSSTFLSLDAFVFFQCCGLFTSSTSGVLRFSCLLGSGVVLTESYPSSSSVSTSPPCLLSCYCDSVCSSLSSRGPCCCV